MESKYTFSVVLILFVKSFVRTTNTPKQTDSCQYQFNVWEPGANMNDRMQLLEIKYANLSNYIDKEIIKMKYSSLSDVHLFQNWTSNLEKILGELKMEQVKRYTDVNTVHEELQRYDLRLKEFGSRFDDFVFHYTNPHPIRRKHSRKDRMLPMSQADTPGTFLMSTLKNMVSDLKSEWILMKRDIIDLKTSNKDIRKYQTELNKRTDDIRTIATNAQTVSSDINNSQNTLSDEIANFKILFKKIDHDLSGLKSAHETLRNDMLATSNGVSALQASHLHRNRLPDPPIFDSRHKESMKKSRDHTSKLARDCTEIADLGYVTSGVYQIQPSPDMPLDNVYCEIVNNTGYTVIQRRTDSLQSFTKGWLEYRFGFGNLYGSFWLGNEIIHKLTKEHLYSLHIDMWDWEGTKKFAEYTVFSVEDEESKFALHVSGFHGDAGDSLSYHDGMRFSTMDNDNDLSSRNCADDFKGGWWYRKGYFSQLNGIYHVGMYSAAQSTFADGIVWYTLRDSDRYSIRKVEMKIKRN